MADVVIDCGGHRDTVLTQLALYADQLAAARLLTADQVAKLVAARAASIAALERALDDRRQRIRRGQQVENPAVLPIVLELPPFAEVPDDVLGELAEDVAFAELRVAKMPAHHAGCTIRMMENGHRMAHRGVGERLAESGETVGWTVSISYAFYPGFEPGEGAE